MIIVYHAVLRTLYATIFNSHNSLYILIYPHF